MSLAISLLTFVLVLLCLLLWRLGRDHCSRTSRVDAVPEDVRSRTR
mgnify:CR=1 FL=1